MDIESDPIIPAFVYGLPSKTFSIEPTLNSGITGQMQVRKQITEDTQPLTYSYEFFHTSYLSSFLFNNYLLLKHATFQR